MGELLKECEIRPNPGSCGFPVIVRGGRNQMGKQIYYFLNYSGEEQKAVCRKVHGQNCFPVKQRRQEIS